MKKILLIIGLAFFVQACGQKGPLYLPDTNQQSQQQPTER